MWQVRTTRDRAIDNVRIASDDWNTTSVYAYDNANEQTTMTVDGTQMTFTYDDWGRIVTRAMAGYTATFDYPLYYAPFRMYSPNSARWTTRDPLGMIDGPNEYGYVREKPTYLPDIYGLIAVPNVKTR